TGTNAWAKAPSANNRRRKLGILKAIKKASASDLEPKYAATTTSRTMPSTRDSMVMMLTTMPDRSRLGALGSGAAGGVVSVMDPSPDKSAMIALTGYT